MKRVLVVDDEALLAEDTARLVRSFGHAAVTAPNAERALERIEKEAAFDLIISDLNMPGMDGLELLARLRNNKDPQKARTSFILYSASDQDLSQVCEDQGAIYVQKGTRGLEVAIEAILGPSQ